MNTFPIKRRFHLDAYSEDDIDYEWKDNIKETPLIAKKVQNLSQYSLVGFEVSKKKTRYTIGKGLEIE